MPQKLGCPSFVSSQYFFQKSGSATFVTLWCPNFMQKLEKNNGLKDITDGQTD